MVAKCHQGLALTFQCWLPYWHGVWCHQQNPQEMGVARAHLDVVLFGVAFLAHSYQRVDSVNSSLVLGFVQLYLLSTPWVTSVKIHVHPCTLNHLPSGNLWTINGNVQ